LLEHGTVDGAVNLCAPEPVTNLELSKTLGRVLNRPALLPVPAFALGLVYGEMASLITTGARMIPQRLQSLGYSFKHPELEDALRAEL
jgi:NAD dependent epimerase/dehydratase family enzyme